VLQLFLEYADRIRLKHGHAVPDQLCGQQHRRVVAVTVGVRENGGEFFVIARERDRWILPGRQAEVFDLQAVDGPLARSPA
jgi:hypothetical protein